MASASQLIDPNSILTFETRGTTAQPASTVAPQLNLPDRSRSIRERPYWDPQNQGPSAPLISEAASEPKWVNRVGEGYVGTKILGTGGYGLVGLWELLSGSSAGSPSKFVVKQSTSSDLSNEATLLFDMGRSSSKHIVKMYKCITIEKAGGTSSRYDKEGNDVARIYLEFCEGGDFINFLKNAYSKYTAGNPMPEELIWRVFKCLALGLNVLETGSEARTKSYWHSDRFHGDIIYFDLKCANILVNGNDNDHMKTPVFKIADFGLDMAVPGVDYQDGLYVDTHEARGTENILAPEQYDRTMDPNERTFATPMNVWQAGKVMYNLITRARTFYKSFPVFWADLEEGNGHTLTMGNDILNAPYSKSLRTTILRCLAYLPSKRPSLSDLNQIIDSSIAACKPAGGNDGFGPGFEAGVTHYPELDQLSAEWNTRLADPTTQNSQPQSQLAPGSADEHL